MPNAVRLHRVLATRPEKVYRAFLEADALAKWLPPNGFACTVHHLEPKVGGKFKMSFRNFTTGIGHSFGGEYVELVPNERLRYTDKFDDPNLAGEIVVQECFLPLRGGFNLRCTRERYIPKNVFFLREEVLIYDAPSHHAKITVSTKNFPRSEGRKCGVKGLAVVPIL